MQLSKTLRFFSTHYIKSAKDFQDLVLKNPKPVVLDFWAEWCPPCKKMKPIIESMKSQDYDVALLNVDEVDQIPAQYEVSGIPCVLLIKEGKEQDRFVGFKVKNDIQQWLKQNGIKDSE